MEFIHGNDENVLSDNSRRNRYCIAPEEEDCQGTSQVVARKGIVLRICFLHPIIFHSQVLFNDFSGEMETGPGGPVFYSNALIPRQPDGYRGKLYSQPPLPAA
jgi:hypothetical protein